MPVWSTSPALSFWLKYLSDVVAIMVGLGILVVASQLSSLLDPVLLDAAYLIGAPIAAFFLWRLSTQIHPRLAAQINRRWAYWLPPVCGLYALNLADSLLPGDGAPLWFKLLVPFACVAIIYLWLAVDLQRLKTNEIRTENLEGQGAAEVGPDDRPIMLFLRSFADDASTLERAATPMLLAGWSVVPPDDVYLDEWLAKTAEQHGFAVYRVGRKDEGSEIVTIVVDGEDWQTTVTDLMERARMLVLLPGWTDGLAREVGELVARNLLFERTLLVFPPEPRARQELRWKLFQVVAVEHGGVTLPPLPESGRVVAARLHRQGEPDWFVSEGTPGVQAYQEAMETLVVHEVAAGGCREDSDVPVLGGASADPVEVIVQRHWPDHVWLVGPTALRRLIATRNDLSIVEIRPKGADPDGWEESLNVLTCAVAILHSADEERPVSGDDRDRLWSRFISRFEFLPDVVRHPLPRALDDLWSWT